MYDAARWTKRVPQRDLAPAVIPCRSNGHLLTVDSAGIKWLTVFGYKPTNLCSLFQLTSLKRPLVVTHDLFKHSIMDISW